MARIREQIDHPIVDGDGHSLEFMPAVREHLVEIAGPELATQLDLVFDTRRLALTMPPEARRAAGLFRLTWWGFPAENTLDRATAMLPQLFYERLDELGIDFAFVYPTYGLVAQSLDQPELRSAFARAFNAFYADAFAGLGDRLRPAAVIPMHTPEEAIVELDHAVNALGHKAVVLAGHVARPLAGANEARAARWIDTLGTESPHDYDPVWQRCRELGVAPTFHSSAMGWGSRVSTENYVYNHLGNFAAAGEATCRSLFMDGVPRRFPGLGFGFLEGGVAWGAALFADLIGHLEKRGGAVIEHLDPGRIDRAHMKALFEKHARGRMAGHVAGIDAALEVLCDPGEDRAGIDEFERAGVCTPEDVAAAFENLYFGCEADDPMNALAYDTARNPLGTRLRAVFGSDIGHWDVPDVRGVLSEAWELVEHSSLSASDFADFAFGGAVALHGSANPDAFAGTRIETAARDHLAKSGAPSA